MRVFTRATEASSDFSYCYEGEKVPYDAKEIIISDKLTSIPAYAFAEYTYLKHIVIPDNITSIGKWAFYKCENLESVTIGNGVTSSLDRTIFSNCFKLKRVIIGSSVADIQSGIFSHSSHLSIIEVSPDNPNYYVSNGCLIEAATKTLIAGDGSSWITIPDGVTSIASSAFESHNNLKRIYIPNSVTSIGWHAFSYCDNLSAIRIPASVKHMGGSVFEYSTGLKIYLEAESIPRGWDPGWHDDSSAKVIWLDEENNSAKEGIDMRVRCSSTKDLDNRTSSSTEDYHIEDIPILLLDARRDAYGISDVADGTMTVRELIQFLEDFDEDSKVVLSYDNGYTYGRVAARRFSEHNLSDFKE